jgi:hypothetical protein
MTGPFASVAVSYAEMGLHRFPCGAVSPDALVIIEALPPRYPDHDTMKNPAATGGGYRVENRTCKSGCDTHSARRKPYDHT